MSHTTLVGAEQVERAGYQIRDAAETMQRAASTFEDSTNRLILALENCTSRLEAALTPPAVQEGEAK